MGMRLVSCTGEIDIPYESAVVSVEGDKIYANCDGNPYLLGKYKDNKTARLVFDKMHEAFMYYSGSIARPFIMPKVFKFPTEFEEVE